MRLAVSLSLAATLAACGQDRIDVAPGVSTDYNHSALVAAVDKFVAAGRTPTAFAELSHTVIALRPGMDRSVADEAELKLVVLAYAPLQSVQAKPMADQIEALALTVWPALISPTIEYDEVLRKRDPKAGELMPRPGEEPHVYLERLCGGPLAAECKHVVPEYQGAVISALAIHRATERVRDAVASCLMCSSEPGWHESTLAWEELDRAANSSINEIENKAQPDNWPIAGTASEDDPGLPEAEVTSRGDLLVGGHSYGPNEQRIAVFRDVRGNGDVMALHIRPDVTLAQARALLVDARKAGVHRVALVARESVYPWRRRIYWVADGSGMRANLRQTDSVQLLLHAIDEVAGPGTVARVD